jgi:hypothetical protein
MQRTAHPPTLQRPQRLTKQDLCYGYFTRKLTQPRTFQGDSIKRVDAVAVAQAAGEIAGHLGCVAAFSHLEFGSIGVSGQFTVIFITGSSFNVVFHGSHEYGYYLGIAHARTQKKIRNEAFIFPTHFNQFEIIFNKKLHSIQRIKV